ncbi:MAG: hypothetical protein IPJ06_05500 [Saprospiraceae bacterium]|nr:hypothetical protein [Saprospiraceae bacterium]
MEKVPSPSNTLLPQEIIIPITFIGTATFGVDYTMDPPFITIPQGSSEVTATFEVFSDNQLEGRESVGMVIQRDPCKLDTIWFYITDDTLPKPDLGPDLWCVPMIWSIWTGHSRFCYPYRSVLKIPIRSA